MAEAHVEESHAAGPSQSQQQGNSSLSSERKKKSAIWAFYSVSLNDASKAVCHTCNELVSRGGKSPRSFNTTNLRKHLEAHPDKYKEFSTMASKYLSIPPSSASSERLFSSAGDIISKERNRLGTEKAEMLLFLKHNLPVFDYKY